MLIVEKCCSQIACHYLIATCRTLNLILVFSFYAYTELFILLHLYLFNLIICALFFMNLDLFTTGKHQRSS